ncbi:MAG: hypothetical protein HC836_15575 [Richelia sp. RM2_1_2]|nr:hypothetical protein [Richelia sp. RM2_1_2]
MTKVSIICKIHGEFKQTPAMHLLGKNCSECAHPSKKYSLKEFIEKANIIHNNIYEYCDTNEYLGNKIKIGVLCKKHGQFLVSPNHH